MASDLFAWGGKDYLICTDYHSNFFEVDVLNETTSGAVIAKLKNHFARYGIPETLVSDNGPQYSSTSFSAFIKEWKIHHELISPGNSQANGAAEVAVKIAKRLMRKCQASNQDFFLGLLNLRNTPTEGLETSPAQRLINRRTKTLVPSIISRLKWENVNSKKEASSKEHNRTKENSQGKTYAHLRTGDNVRIQPLVPGNREWKEATVTKQLTNRSYEVETDRGQRYRRNRRHLRSTEKSIHTQPSQQRCIGELTIRQTNSKPPDNDKHVTQELHSPVPCVHPSVPVTTRSGRRIVPPSRYQDDVHGGVKDM